MEIGGVIRQFLVSIDLRGVLSVPGVAVALIHQLRQKSVIN